jgi:hypothetical protein
VQNQNNQLKNKIIPMNQIYNDLQKLQNDFITLGLPQEQTAALAKQYELELVKNISIQALKNKKFQPQLSSLNIDEIEDFIKTNYSADELKTVMEASIIQTTTDFFTKVLAQLPDEKVEQFKGVIASW